ncbi:hypothetical protein KI387_020252 [Taxus chinensis]|uniref:Uncharacterized protein n=1 Tax=Taxus chinensis TaxID=29808 RepID=A0AA38LBC6_TAXCH|nr:hypothetical protein KI387_020252 [Taxus chinensis]
MEKVEEAEKHMEKMRIWKEREQKNIDGGRELGKDGGEGEGEGGRMVGVIGLTSSFYGWGRPELQRGNGRVLGRDGRGHGEGGEGEFDAAFKTKSAQVLYLNEVVKIAWVLVWTTNSKNSIAKHASAGGGPGKGPIPVWVHTSCNSIKHLTSSEHMVCLKSFWLENGADVQKRDKYCISQQEFAKWENRCKYFESLSTSSGDSSNEVLNNIHSKHSSVNMDTLGNVSIKNIANNPSDSVLPLQHLKDKSFQVSSQGDNKASMAHLASQDVHLLNFSDGIDANQESLWKHAQQSKHMHLLSKNGLIQAGAAARDSVAKLHAVSTTLSNFPRHEEGYNVASSLQDGYQGIEHHLTCIRTPSLLPGEVKENIHTGAPPPWLNMDGENEVIYNGTSADIQILSKTRERKLKKTRNPKRVGATWAEQRRAELQRELKGETSTTNVANDSWLPNFGRVWQSGSRKDSRKEFEAEKNIERTFVTKTDNTAELQPYISKRIASFK